MFAMRFWLVWTRSELSKWQHSLLSLWVRYVSKISTCFSMDDITCTLCCSSETDQYTDNYIKGRLKLCDQLYVVLLPIPLIILSQKSLWRRSSYISGVNKLQTARGGLFTCICWVSCLRIVPPKCNLISSCISWYAFPKFLRWQITDFVTFWGCEKSCLRFTPRGMLFHKCNPM